MELTDWGFLGAVYPSSVASGCFRGTASVNSRRERVLVVSMAHTLGAQLVNGFGSGVGDDAHRTSPHAAASSMLQESHGELSPENLRGIFAASWCRERCSGLWVGLWWLAAEIWTWGRGGCNGFRPIALVSFTFFVSNSYQHNDQTHDRRLMHERATMPREGCDDTGPSDPRLWV